MTAATSLPTHPALERHYTLAEVAKRWGMGESVVYRIFAELPGVLRYCGGRDSSKRRRVTMRIPESVLVSVHEKLVSQEPAFFRRNSTGGRGSRKSNVAAAASRSF